MRIRAHVLTPSNNTIASSMIESLRAGVTKACAPVAKLSSFSCRRRPDETIFLSDENILKQTAAYLVGNKTGTADMQFIFDLIWNQSRSKFLATIGEQEAEQ